MDPLEVKIELQKVRDGTRVIVATRRKGRLWAIELNMVAGKVKIHTQTPLKIEPYMGDDHRHAAPAPSSPHPHWDPGV